MSFMFRLMTVLFVALVVTNSVQAQMQPNKGSSTTSKFEVTAQMGYSFGALVNTYDGQIRLDPGVWYGGALDFKVGRGVMIELSYFNRTESMTQRNGSAWQPGFEDNLGEVTTQYVQIGSHKSFRKGKIAPFIGGGLGVGWYQSDIVGSTTSTFFTLSGMGGAKIYLSEHFGIRLQGRLFLPIFWGSVGFYCGGGGCGTGIGGSGTVEGELSGGLFLAF